MKKMLKIGVFVLLVAALTGCMTINQSQPSVPLAAGIETKLKADITVGEKITGQSSMNILLGIFKFGGDTKFADGVAYSGGGGGGGVADLLDVTASVKSAAAYNAVKKANADVIILPTYVVEVEDYMIFKKVTATVTGYKGTIKGVQ